MRISNFMRSVALAAMSAVFAGCSGAGSQVMPAANVGAASQRQVPETSVTSTNLDIGDTTENWSQTYFNSSHGGFNANETTISTSNVANLKLLWGQNVMSGVTGLALDNAMIYAQGADTSGPPVLVAMNAATGNTLWTATTGDDGYPLNGTVATGAGDVYVGCGTSGTGHPGGVCAFGQVSGKQRWSYIPDCNCTFNGTVESPLVYSGGVVYYGASGFPGQSDPYVVALNAKTGIPIWSYDPGPGALGSAALAVSAGEVFFDCVTTGNVSGICAVKKSGGNLLWHATTGNSQTAFSIEAGVLYASTDQNFVVALSAATGSQLWSSAAAIGKSAFPPAITTGAIYVAGNTSISALKSKNGRSIWSSPLTCSPQSSPSVANGVVYVYQGGNNCPAVSAFDIKTGALLSSITTSAANFNVSPVVANGTLYITNGACGPLCAFVPRQMLRQKIPTTIFQISSADQDDL
jgi:outer membrane protein assembly factor BamB